MKRAEERRRERLAAQMLKRAMQQHSAGRLRQAAAAYQEVLSLQPRHPVALQLLGVIAYQSGDTARAIELITGALTIEPRYAEAHYNLANILKALDRLEEAAAGYRKALALQPGYAEAHSNLGATLQLLGRHGDAVESFRNTLTLQPENPVAHNNLAAALYKLGRWNEAVLSYREAIALKPDYAEAHCNLGAALLDLGRRQDGRASFQRAIALKPDYVQAHANLAEVYEKANQTEDLRAAVAEAKRHCPSDLRIALREAWLLKRDGNVDKARALLEDRALLEGAGRPEYDNRFLVAREHLLGDLCDRMDDAAAAFEHFRQGNLLGGETLEAKKFDRNLPLAEIDQLTRHFTADWVQTWRPLAPCDDRPDPVFLVGFPRSGTTLLDSILRSHPKIAVVEEMPTLWSARQSLKKMGRVYPEDGHSEGLATLAQDELSELRRVYFAELSAHLDPEDQGAVVVDKMPLNTIQAGLIHRIFPKARFIFAKRHPCDCVLSCFMREFVLSDFMVNYLDLEAAARLYDKTMTLWQQYRAILPLRVHFVRYETLIESFEETLVPLIDFLDLPWDEALHDYAQTARRRQKIHTPSYNQVTQPLYTDARGRWERYRAEMQPVLPILLPWAEKFGYG